MVVVMGKLRPPVPINKRRPTRRTVCAPLPSRSLFLPWFAPDFEAMVGCGVPKAIIVNIDRYVYTSLNHTYNQDHVEEVKKTIRGTSYREA